jgi:hypothetical protein
MPPSKKWLSVSCVTVLCVLGVFLSFRSASRKAGYPIEAPVIRPIRPPGTPLFLKDHRNGTSTTRIAISLVIGDRLDLIEPMLESLTSSDIMFYRVTLFCFATAPDSEATNFMRKYSKIHTIMFTDNDPVRGKGITLPRLRIMQDILASPDPYHWQLEIHDDMYFPQNWFEQLITNDGPDVGILEPFIINNYPVKLMTASEMESILVSKQLVQPKVYTNCLQVHPWLVKISMIRKIGYYDPEFSPQEMEDDDFYYRVVTSGYTAVAVQTSWVAHRGTTTRKVSHYLLQEHHKLFIEKTGMTVKEFNYNVLNHCHPAFYVLLNRKGFENPILPP